MTDTATTEPESGDTRSKPTKEVTVVQDQGFFRHDTGDMYDGYFEAKKKDRSVKMHGIGVYTTAEGDSYSGHWESDRLGANEEVLISFADGSKYEGLFKDWCYTSRGKYMYPDGAVLQGEFSENCPIGSLKLADPNGHIWLGKADQGYGWFEPVNHFYEFLETTREYDRLRRCHKIQQELPQNLKSESKLK